MAPPLAILGAVGAAASAVGTISSAEAAGSEASYQAQVAQNNATIASENARQASAAGAQQAAVEGQKSAAQMGAIRTAEAANNIDVNSGSAVDVQKGARETGEESALTDENNALMSVYGYRSQATGFEATAGLEQTQAAEAPVAGILGAGGSLLSNASTLPSKYQWMTSPSGGSGPGDYGTDPEATSSGSGSGNFGGIF